jgi:TRAP-type transport system small permease protein
VKDRRTVQEQSMTAEGGRGDALASAGPARATSGAGALAVLAAATERLSAICARLTELASLVLTGGFLLCLVLQIVARYVFNAPLSWTEEMAVFLFVWTMLLLASLGVREGFHVRLEFLSPLLPSDAWRAGLETLLTAAIAVFGVIMTVTGWQLVELVWGNTSAAIQYPMQALYFAGPISGLLIVVHAVAILLVGRREGGGK